MSAVAHPLSPVPPCGPHAAQQPEGCCSELHRVLSLCKWQLWSSLFTCLPSLLTYLLTFIFNVFLHLFREWVRVFVCVYVHAFMHVTWYECICYSIWMELRGHTRSCFSPSTFTWLRGSVSGTKLCQVVSPRSHPAGHAFSFQYYLACLTQPYCPP